MVESRQEVKRLSDFLVKRTPKIRRYWEPKVGDTVTFQSKEEGLIQGTLFENHTVHEEFWMIVDDRGGAWWWPIDELTPKWTET